MKKTILLCWVGITDLKAASGEADVGSGPIAQAVANENYTEIILLDDWKDVAKTENYIPWLQQKTQSPITLKRISLSSPTNFGEIYQAACKVIADKQEEHGIDADFTYHLSPGTPAMAAVWILIAKTRFPAKLIESSKEHGVRPASVPFDISADFIPDLLRRQDKTLERLAFGLSDKSPEFDNIIHRSEVMQRVVLKARRVALRSVPVLIEGESGTGKELF
ncbi:MAG: sigma 54-interacting transcriptional regulator, partial [Desulfamplus sp.]|nr:sigma 54-interacting transcriptional regulator [Desulfamplus sp.]